jgi:hypothetical protein
LAGGALTLVALVAYALVYRSALDYRFEVTAIALTWLTLGASAVLVAVDLRRTTPHR